MRAPSVYTLHKGGAGHPGSLVTVSHGEAYEAGRNPLPVKATSTKAWLMQSREEPNSPALEFCIYFQQVRACVAQPQACYPYPELH